MAKQLCIHAVDVALHLMVRPNDEQARQHTTSLARALVDATFAALQSPRLWLALVAFTIVLRSTTTWQLDDAACERSRVMRAGNWTRVPRPTSWWCALGHYSVVDVDDIEPWCVLRVASDGRVRVPARTDCPPREVEISFMCLAVLGHYCVLDVRPSNDADDELLSLSYASDASRALAAVVALPSVPPVAKATTKSPPPPPAQREWRLHKRRRQGGNVLVEILAGTVALAVVLMVCMCVFMATLAMCFAVSAYIAGALGVGLVAALFVGDGATGSSPSPSRSADIQ